MIILHILGKFARKLNNCSNKLFEFLNFGVNKEIMISLFMPGYDEKIN